MLNSFLKFLVVAMLVLSTVMTAEAGSKVELTPESCVTVVNAVAASRLNGTTFKESMLVSRTLGADFVNVTNTVYNMDTADVEKITIGDNIVAKRICMEF